MRRQNHPAISKLFTLKSDAEKWARDAELKIEKGVFDVGFERSNETLGEILERYLREVTPKKKGRSVEGIRLKKIIRNPIAATKIGLLKPIHIVRYRENSTSQHHSRGDVAGPTQRHHWQGIPLIKDGIKRSLEQSL